MLQTIIPAIYTSSPALKEGALIRGEALNTVFRVLSRPYGLTNIFYQPLPGGGNFKEGDVGESIDVGKGNARNVEGADHVNPIAHVGLLENAPTIGTHLTDGIRDASFARVAKPGFRTEKYGKK